MSDYTIFLFDIDGVLVAPFGYREAVRATLGYFYQQMKFPESLLPDEDVLSGFEAIRITSEWDMVPICLATVIDGWLSVNPDFILPDRISQALHEIGKAAAVTILPGDPGFLRLLQALKGAPKAGEYPADTVLNLAGAVNSDIYPNLAGSRLLDSLLARSRDIKASTTTRIFQHYTLGSQAFQASYQLPPSIQTESLLARYDQPLLPPDLSRRLLNLRAQRAIYSAAFTMRPSLAPRGVDDSSAQKYVPEAEIALELVQLAGIPLVGYGRMLYLAEQLGLEAESLLKPSPVQAIAAILAAISGDENQALSEAYCVYAKSREYFTTFIKPIIKPGDRLLIHVFEDSAGGIEAVFKAADILTAAGFPSQVSAHGIATHPQKTIALEQAGATIYTSTAQAVRQVLEPLSGE
jgi:hypothetical protein